MEPLQEIANGADHLRLTCPSFPDALPFQSLLLPQDEAKVEAEAKLILLQERCSRAEADARGSAAHAKRLTSELGQLRVEETAAREDYGDQIAAVWRKLHTEKGLKEAAVMTQEKHRLQEEEASRQVAQLQASNNALEKVAADARAVLAEVSALQGAQEEASIERASAQSAYDETLYAAQKRIDENSCENVTTSSSAIVASIG